MDGYHINAINTTRTVAAALAAAAFVVLVTLPQISGSGSFQVFLSSYLNEQGLDSDGNCCSGHPPLFESCNSSSQSDCRTLFRICLSHFQSASVPIHPDRSPPSTCSFGSAVTPVLGGNSFRVPEVLGSFVNPVDLPFSFTWPGSFALTIEAWHDNESLLMTPSADPGNSSSYRGSLISRLSIQQFLTPDDGWQEVRRHSNRTTIHFRYRVVCSSNYYGPGCSETCRSRNDFFGHYVCSENGTKQCLGGWTGEYCNTAVCSPGCHQVHGFCEEPNECKCRLGWEGETCARCVIYPGCDHGTCREPWTCNCEPGWGGIFCNQDLNFCANHSPCLNGATCTNTGLGGYTCLCPPGSTGTNCEMDTDDCRPQHLSCLNGGLCKVTDDVSAIYECYCADGFHGRRCESSSFLPFPSSSYDVTCSDGPCQNGGVCSAQPSVTLTALRYRCSCRPGYRGFNCQDRIDGCVTNQPCLNGGRCIHESDGVRCLCPTGYDGNRCQTNHDECTGSPCLNDGACVDETNNFRCVCRPGFIGRLCQEEKEEQDKEEEGTRNCSQSSSLCSNGATCLDLFGGFRCACADGFSGKFCTMRVGACASDPCRNGTTCVETGPAQYRCLCPRGNCDARSSDDRRDDAIAIDGYVYNYSTAGNVTMAQLSLVLVKQLAMLIGIGLSVPLLILTIVGACLVLKRRKFSRRRNVEVENERNNVRSLNNRRLLSSQSIDMKPVLENGVLLKPDDSGRNKNLLLRVENNEKYLRKSNNLDRCNVDKNFELDA